jgi:hypothetical protein
MLREFSIGGVFGIVTGGILIGIFTGFVGQMLSMTGQVLLSIVVVIVMWCMSRWDFHV